MNNKKEKYCTNCGKPESQRLKMYGCTGLCDFQYKTKKQTLPDMTIKTQCEDCKNIFIGIGDNICPNCEGWLHEIKNTNYSLKEEIKAMKNTDQPMSPNIDNFLQESLDKEELSNCCGVEKRLEGKNWHTPYFGSKTSVPSYVEYVCSKCMRSFEPSLPSQNLVEKEEAEIIDKAMPPIIHKDNWEENYPIPDKEEWEIEFEKIIMAFAEHADSIGANFVRDKEIDKVKQFIQKVSAQSYDKGQREYKQFTLNVLDGQDIADKEMGVVGGTKAIRLAINSRII